MSVYNGIYRACVLVGPPLDDDLPAGLPMYLGQFLLHGNPLNGAYQDVRRALDKKRIDVTSDYLTCARAKIAATFHYKFEEMDEWDAETFFERLAQAEFVTGQPLEPKLPEALQRQSPH